MFESIKVANWVGYNWDNVALQLYQPDPRSLSLYICQASKYLAFFQRYHSDIRSTLARLSYSEWANASQDYWSYEFEVLQWQASKIGVASSRIREAQDLATCDLFRACRMLLQDLHRRTIEGVAFLRAGMLRAGTLASIRVIRFAATVYRLRNKMSLEREFYISHGAHPADDAIRTQMGRSIQLGGHTPALAL